MKTVINKESLKRYTNYLNEFLMLEKSGKKYKISELISIHGVIPQVNTWAKNAGLINITGIGINATYRFNYNNFEPIHARMLLNSYLKYKEKNKEIPPPQPNISGKKGARNNTIRKYTSFFNDLKILINSEANFNINLLIQRHKITKSIMKYAVLSGLLERDKKGKYIFKKSISNYTISEVLKIINENQNIKLKQYRSEGKCIDRPKYKQEENSVIKRATNSITEYRLFGIKIMTSYTKYFTN